MTVQNNMKYTKVIFMACAAIFFLSGFFIFSASHASAQVQGTITINAGIFKLGLDGYSVVGDQLRGPSPEEIPYFLYDVGALTNIGINQAYSLPAGNYQIVFKSTPNGLVPVRRGVFDLPYTFTITAGQNTSLTIPYSEDPKTHPCYLTGATIDGRDIKVNLGADVVDYQGGFVRNMSAEEAGQVSFTAVTFTGAQSFGGTTGQFENSGTGVAGVTKLGSYYLAANNRRPIYGPPTYRLININAPSGLALRSISGGTVNVNESLTNSDIPNVYLYFEGSVQGNWFLPPFVCSVADPNLKPELNVTLHFAQQGTSATARAEDKFLYAGGSNSGLDFVKRIVQTYGNASAGTDLEAGYLEQHSDGRLGHGGSKPFPKSVQVANFSGKPYLFVNASSRILVYDISNPASPVFKNQVTADQLFALGPPSHLSQSTLINSSPIKSFRSVAVSDDSSYILVTLWMYQQTGVAMIKIDPASMSMTPDVNLTYFEQGQTSPLNGTYASYKGGDGKTYYLGGMPGVGSPGSTRGQNLFWGGSTWDYIAFTISDAGKLVLSKTLTPAYGQGDPYQDYPLKGTQSAAVATVGAKTYLFAQTVGAYSTAPVVPATMNIYDVSNPASVSLAASFNVANSRTWKLMAVDGKGKKAYVGIIAPADPAGRLKDIKVFDLSSLPASVTELGSFGSFCAMAKLSDNTDAIQEFKKYLNIPAGIGIVNTNCLFSALAASGNKVVVSLFGYPTIAGINIPGSEAAIVTEYSYYYSPYYQVAVDVTDFSNPKILGLMGLRHIVNRASGAAMSPSIEADTLSPQFALVYRDRYLFRALGRTADVLEFTNILATAGPTTPPPPTGGTPIIIRPPTFIFQNLLNMFKRILLFKIGG